MQYSSHGSNLRCYDLKQSYAEIQRKQNYDFKRSNEVSSLHTERNTHKDMIFIAADHNLCLVSLSEQNLNFKQTLQITPSDYIHKQ